MKSVIYLVLVLLCGQNAYSQDIQDYSLFSLDSLEVNITVDIEELDFYTLENNLKNKIELRLRQNNLKLGPNSLLTSLNFRVLGLKVTKSDNLVGYTIKYELSVEQAVLLPNNLTTIPILWRSSGIALTGTNGLNDTLREIAEALMDEFLNKYLAMND